MDLLVEAYIGIAAGVSVQHIRENLVTAILGGFDTCYSVVASVGHFDGNIGVDGPADGEVKDVSGDEPRKHENTKSNVASGLHAHVLEQLRNLHTNGQYSARSRYRARTYREDQIDYIHQTQDDIANLGLVVAVAANQKQTCDDVVGEHLPMILSALLNVDDQNLLQPEAELSQVVQLEKASH